MTSFNQLECYVLEFHGYFMLKCFITLASDANKCWNVDYWLTH